MGVGAHVSVSFPSVDGSWSIEIDDAGGGGRLGRRGRLYAARPSGRRLDLGVVEMPKAPRDMEGYANRIKAAGYPHVGMDELSFMAGLALTGFERVARGGSGGMRYTEGELEPLIAKRMSALSASALTPLVHIGEINLLSASGGVGKTTVGLDAALRYSAQDVGNRALYLDTERRRDMVEHKLDGMLAGGCERGGYDGGRLHYRMSGSLSDGGREMTELLNSAGSLGCGGLLVVLDTSTRSVGSVNNQLDVDYLFDLLTRAVEYGRESLGITVTWLLLHHVSKATREQVGGGVHRPTGNSAWEDRATRLVSLTHTALTAMGSDGKARMERWVKGEVVKWNYGDMSDAWGEREFADDSPSYNPALSGFRIVGTGEGGLHVEYRDNREWHRGLVRAADIKAKRGEEVEAAKAEEARLAEVEREKALEVGRTAILDGLAERNAAGATSSELEGWARDSGLSRRVAQALITELTNGGLIQRLNKRSPFVLTGRGIGE